MLICPVFLTSGRHFSNVIHDDIIKWKHFPRYRPFVCGIHRSPVNSPHKGQWRGTLIFTLICARINGWVNNCEAGNLRRNRAHYDVIVMFQMHIDLGQHLLRQWLAAWRHQAMHCLNQCWLLITETLRHSTHDDVIKWIHFPCYWPFVRGIHPSPVNSPHKGQWRGVLMFSLICALNKRLSKQSWGWWFETPLRSLWHHCNVGAISQTVHQLPSCIIHSDTMRSKSLPRLTGDNELKSYWPCVYIGPGNGLAPWGYYKSIPETMLAKVKDTLLPQ